MKHQKIPLRQDVRYVDAPIPSPPWFVAVPFFILGFVFSLWYVDAYYGGDNLFYRRFYDILYGMPTARWADLQRAHVGSAEPFYRYIIGLAAFNGWDRPLYLSAWNGVFVGAIGYVLIKHRCSALFCLFVLTNFYLIVLLGSSERLKFAYVALVLAFAIDNPKIKFVVAASSPFFHTQAMIQFASGFGYYIAANLRDFAKTPLRTIGLATFAVVVVGGIIYLFVGAVGQSVESKSAYYSDQSSGILEAVQWGMLVVAGLIVFKERLAYFVGMAPMGLLTVLFGNRVNVATFALFAGLAILQRRTSNPIVLAVMAYMSFKSVPFLIDVALYGDGFAAD